MQIIKIIAICFTDNCHGTYLHNMQFSFTEFDKICLTLQASDRCGSRDWPLNSWRLFLGFNFLNVSSGRLLNLFLESLCADGVITY
jgi:hypothetical protein